MVILSGNMDYSRLVRVYEELSSTSKLLEKRDIISNFLKTVNNSNLVNSVNLLQGRTFSECDQRKLGVGTQLIIKALVVSSGISSEEVNKQWVKLGDLGKVAEKIMSDKKQATLVSGSLTINGIIDRNQKIAEIEGSGAVLKKVNLISELIT